jgi:Ca-activated chloride channel family protein
MLKLDTMLQRTNRLIFVSIAVLCFAGWLLAQSTTAPPPAQNTQNQSQTQQAPAKPGQPLSPAEMEGPPTQPAQTAQPANGQQPAPPATQQGSQQQQPTAPGGQLSPGELEGPPTQQGPAQPNAQQPAAQGQAGEVQQGEGNVFVIKKQVEEVQLHASVIDEKQHPVTNLDRDAFTVFEDGQPQRITSFRREDIPVALGILIDNSGSMRDKRAQVNQAALNLVRASNPQDEVFVVNFNDESYLDTPLTNNMVKLKEGLDHIDSRGGTAMYDAVIASVPELKRSKLDKKVLLVVTDGEDNSSRMSLEQAVRHVQDENGPVIYTIGIFSDDQPKKKRDQRALRTLSERTGGVAFFPRDLHEVDQISQDVAHDIRNQYTIGYKPLKPQSQGGYRAVRVEAKSKGFGRMQVRTRSGYYAGQANQTAAK